MISAHEKLDRIAQRGAADGLDADAGAESHFQQATAKLGVAADFGDLAAMSDVQFAQQAGAARHFLGIRHFVSHSSIEGKP